MLDSERLKTTKIELNNNNSTLNNAVYFNCFNYFPKLLFVLRFKAHRKIKYLYFLVSF